MKFDKKNITEIVFILDKSGSMYNLTDDTIGGFNSMIREQKENKDECIVTTVLFNDESRKIHDRIPLQDVPELTREEYVPDGWTALLDAVGTTLTDIKARQATEPESERPDRTLVIITTDGHENASREYTIGHVKQMIQDLKKENWEFIFLGANIDAVSTAQTYGIDSSMAIGYNADSIGTGHVYHTVSSAMSMSRSMSMGQSMGTSFTSSNAWRKEIDEDFANRSSCGATSSSSSMTDSMSLGH